MKKLFSYMMVCGAMMTAVLGFTSCEDDLDVQQAYPFTVETMPVPKRLVQGETAEIRCEIVREGYFSDTRYTIRYFQPDGECTLRMDDGMVLLPNDRKHPIKYTKNNGCHSFVRVCSHCCYNSGNHCYFSICVVRVATVHHMMHSAYMASLQ